MLNQFIDIHEHIQNFFMYMYSITDYTAYYGKIKDPKKFLSEVIIILNGEHRDSLSVTDFVCINNINLEQMFEDSTFFENVTLFIHNYSKLEWYDLITMDALFHKFVICYIHEYGKVLVKLLEMQLNPKGTVMETYDKPMMMGYIQELIDVVE
jgi:hypothetical protein